MYIDIMILWIYYVDPWYLSTRITLLCVSHTYMQRYTAHSGTNRLTPPYKYILIPPDTCSQKLSVLHWIIHWYQKFTLHNVFLFKNYSLVEDAYLFIRCKKTKFFLWSTNNTDINGVTKQNSHKPNT